MEEENNTLHTDAADTVNPMNGNGGAEPSEAESAATDNCPAPATSLSATTNIPPLMPAGYRMGRSPEARPGATPDARHDGQQTWGKTLRSEQARPNAFHPAKPRKPIFGTPVGGGRRRTWIWIVLLLTAALGMAAGAYYSGLADLLTASDDPVPDSATIRMDKDTEAADSLVTDTLVIPRPAEDSIPMKHWNHGLKPKSIPADAAGTEGLDNGIDDGHNAPPTGTATHTAPSPEAASATRPHAAGKTDSIH